MELTDLSQYWCMFLVNDRKNNRVEGKHLPKRIKTVDQRGCACWFQFIVKWDINFCLYIELKQQSGHAFHFSNTKLIHPILVSVPTCLLTSDKIDNIVHVVNATSNN
jgi:hypothetical protein